MLNMLQARSSLLRNIAVHMSMIHDINDLCFVTGATERMAPEAPAPQPHCPNLGPQCHIVAVVGRCPNLRNWIEKDFDSSWKALVKKRDQLQSDIDLRKFS